MKTAQDKYNLLKVELAKTGQDKPDPSQSASLAQDFIEALQGAIDAAAFYVAEKDADGNESVAGQGVEGAKTTGKAKALFDAQKAVADALGDKNGVNDKNASTQVHKALEDLEAANTVVANRAGTDALLTALTNAVGLSDGSGNPAAGTTLKLAEEAKTKSEAIVTPPSSITADQAKGFDAALLALKTQIDDGLTKAIDNLKTDPGKDADKFNEVETAFNKLKNSVNGVEKDKLETLFNTHTKAKAINDKVTETTNGLKDKFDAIGVPSTDGGNSNKLLNEAETKAKVVTDKNTTDDEAKTLPENDAATAAVTKLGELKTGIEGVSTALTTLTNDDNVKKNEALLALLNTASGDVGSFKSAVETAKDKATAAQTQIQTARSSGSTTTYAKDDATFNAIKELQEAMSKGEGDTATGVTPSAAAAKKAVDAVVNQAKDDETAAASALSNKATASKAAVHKAGESGAAATGIHADAADLDTKAKLLVAENLKKAQDDAATKTAALKTQIETIEKDGGTSEPKLLTTLKAKAQDSDDAEKGKPEQELKKAQEADGAAREALEQANNELSKSQESLQTAKADEEDYKQYDADADANYESLMSQATKEEKAADEADAALNRE